MTLFLDGHSLSLDALDHAAHDPTVTIAVRDADWQPLEDCSRLVQQCVDDYVTAYTRDPVSAPAAAVYGVTTGYGEFKTVPIAPEDLGRLSRNILLSHAVGFGVNEDIDDPANYFAPEVVRAAIILRINTFLKGHSGVRRGLVEYLLAMANAGVVPLVPVRGSVGSSGDLCPLAHLFATLLGVGRFYTVPTADAVRAGMRGRTLQPATDLPAVISMPPYEIGFKDGLALTNGAVISTALLALAVTEAENLAETADAATALTLEAIRGRIRAFDPKIHAARNMAGQIASARTIRDMVRGSKLVGVGAQVQDVYSVRCAPAVHGASRDAMAYARMVAEAEVNAATDNPLFFPGEFPEDTGPDGRAVANDPQRNHEGRAYSAGNFHGQPVGLAADVLAIAVAELASISERRTQMLLDDHLSEGLPANLIADGGLNSGLMLLQYTAAALVSENKILCHPSTVDSIPTSANSEDHVAMATTAARKVGQVLANTKHVLASELLAASQAVEWRVLDRSVGLSDRRKAALQLEQRFETAYGGTAPGRSAVTAALGIGTRAVYEAVRSRVGPLVRDELLEPLPRAVRTLIAERAVSRIVAESVHGGMAPKATLMLKPHAHQSVQKN